MAEADALSFELPEKRAPLTAGAKLRAARERAGLDRAQLSLRTKINERHLGALEESDFAALPARIYAVGFSRTYAAAVGLDPADIVADVRRELAGRDKPAPPAHQLDIEDPAKIPSRALAWAAGLAALGLLALGAVLWRSTFVPAVELPPVREEVVATAPAAPELSPSAMVSPTAESALGSSGPAAAAPVSTPARPAPRSVPVQARPAAAAPAATQSLPAPVPERLEPLAAPAPADPPAQAGDGT